VEKTSQILIRNLHRIYGANLLVVNAPDDKFLSMLGDRQADRRSTHFTYDYALHRRHLASLSELARLNFQFGAYYHPERPVHDAALLFLPKSRPLIEMTLAMIAPALADGGLFFLVGENQAGVRSSATLIETYIGPVRTLDAARHCVLFHAVRQRAPTPFDLDAWLTRYAINLDAYELAVVSLPGVFSHGRLDEGTQLLLSTLTDAPGDTVLDFGCGAGLIGAAIQQRWPATQIDLVDSSALALEAARRTWRANGFTPHGIFASDVFSDVTERYDQIISNPPFHTGIRKDDTVVKAFFQAARQHLMRGGRLRIVANRFLDYRPRMAAAVGPCRIVAENRQFVVLESVVGG
jgi:16S rRNA (guanine1207-N2)-methyltransferase